MSRAQRGIVAQPAQRGGERRDVAAREDQRVVAGPGDRGRADRAGRRRLKMSGRPTIAASTATMP